LEKIIENNKRYIKNIKFEGKTSDIDYVIKEEKHKIFEMEEIILKLENENKILKEEKIKIKIEVENNNKILEKRKEKKYEEYKELFEETLNKLNNGNFDFIKDESIYIDKRRHPIWLTKYEIMEYRKLNYSPPNLKIFLIKTGDMNGLELWNYYKQTLEDILKEMEKIKHIEKEN